MKVLVVGAGGVGAAFAAIAQRRPAFERVVLADVSTQRAHDVVARLGEAGRFAAERVDASSRAELVELIARVKPDAVLNACDPRFNEPIFAAAFEARVTYLDMAMTLSHPHPQRPYELPGGRCSATCSSRVTSSGSRPACWRSWGSASSRVSPTSSPATRPRSCSRRSRKSGCATARTWSSRATTSRRPSRSGRRSRSA